MYVHPLEVAGYYCIFYGSFLIYPVHYYGVVFYLIVHGLAGILDHSGIRVSVPFIYNTIDHGMF